MEFEIFSSFLIFHSMSFYFLSDYFFSLKSSYRLFDLFRNRIYRFHAERLNIHKCEFTNSAELKPDASNLAEVLYFIYFIKDNVPISTSVKLFTHRDPCAVRLLGLSNG